MKTNNLSEDSLTLLLQARERHAAENRLHRELAGRYAHLSRLAALRHHTLASCTALLLLLALWTATPAAQAAATSRCPLQQRIAAIDTSQQIIQAL